VISKNIQKELRIARVYCGKIVDDKTFKAGTRRVTLGEYKQTLLVPLLGINEGFSLMERSGGSYTLRVTNQMSGKLHIGGKDLYLNELLSLPSAKKSGSVQTPNGNAEVYEVQLQDNDWGLLKFGDQLEVIFQFVVPGAAILSATALSGGAGMTAGAIRSLTSLGGVAMLLSGLVLVGSIFYVMYKYKESVSLEQYSEEADRSLSFKSDQDEKKLEEETEPTPPEEVEVVMTDLPTPPQPPSDKFNPTQKPGPEGEGKNTNAPPSDKGPKGMNLGPEFAKSISASFGSGAMGEITDQAFTNLTGGDAFANSGMGVGGIGGSMGGGGGGPGGGAIGGLGGGPGGGGDNGGSPTVNRAKPKVKPSFTPGPPKAGNFCKSDDIKSVVSKKSARIRNCYERRLLADPKLSGKVIAQWKIQLDGSVKDAKVSTSTIGDDEVGRCLVRLLETSKFNTPDGGICVVEYPFTFTSQ
jgi:hypothetical protein